MDQTSCMARLARRVAGAAAAAGWLVLGAAATAAYAQERDAPRLKTESPYFFVKSGDASVDRLPLKSTEVDVRISGVIADVTVVQRYRNEGQHPIEAKYVFPGSTRAAVYGMNVRLGERLITAQIREKQQARIEYNEAARAGKTAALLEQHLPNVFQMNVANILPGDDVRVELRYTELLVPQAGQYQFVFPTVVGPRYNSPQSSQALASWVKQPFLPAGEASNTAFSMQVALHMPLGLKEVQSTTHAVKVTRESERDAKITLEPQARNSNRDFILDYRLAGERIESGALLFQGGDENFFLAMVEPPHAVTPASIAPREYIFVVDISGSMHGFPLNTAKAMLRELIGGLRASDSFNVLLFAGSNRMLAKHSVPATRANIEQALSTIDGYHGSGSTELIPALRRVYEEPKREDIARTVVVVTDGYVTVEQEAFELIRRHLSQANVFAFGIGSSVNRHLIEGMARAGMGEPFVITQASEAAEQAQRFRRMIESPVLTSVKARFEGLEVYDVEPPHLPDVLGERPVIIFGKWRANAAGTVPQGQIIIEGHSASGPYRQAIAIGPQIRQDTSALRYLWARHRIASLSDEQSLAPSERLSREITGLGLQYGLLTEYTSFIAVDHVVRNPAPHNTLGVNQPSPLPQGVGDQAIGEAAPAMSGTEVPGTPEPAAWAAAGLVLSMLFMLERRARRRRGHFTA